jgi:hypothetical protein
MAVVYIQALAKREHKGWRSKQKKSRKSKSANEGNAMSASGAAK